MRSALVSTRDAHQRWSLAEPSLGIVAALVLAWLVGFSISRGIVPAGTPGAILSYLATWVPLGAAVAFATYVRGQKSFRLDFGLRFTWLDLLFGFAVGFLLRTIATLFEIILYGRPAGAGVTFGQTDYDIWWLLLAIIAPVIIAPIVEELFFRGLLQRAVLKASSRSMVASSRWRAVLAVTVSSLVFATVHVLQTSSEAQAAVVGISTLVLGIGLGTLAAVTGRLGGSIVAHIVFNGLGVLALLL